VGREVAAGVAMTELELPFPPSVNHYYRRVGPRTLISREGRRFRERVCSLLAASGVRRVAGPLRVEIEVYPPDRRRRDIDNSMKALLDTLQHGGLYRDDSQIAKLEIERRDPVPGGRTLVRIEEYR
jgi:crossover junction endodeoxyribonuclease RusA